MHPDDLAPIVLLAQKISRLHPAKPILTQLVSKRLVAQPFVPLPRRYVHLPPCKAKAIEFEALLYEANGIFCNPRTTFS